MGKDVIFQSYMHKSEVHDSHRALKMVHVIQTTHSMISGR